MFSVSECGMTNSVSNPLTPDQAKAQVIDAAREVVGLLGLRVVDGKANVWLESCNDQEDPPFRGAGIVGYPKAASSAEADAELANMIRVLQEHGWSGDPDFYSHGSVLKKNNVVVDFARQNDFFETRNFDIRGECRDVTTTKATKGSTEPIVFGT
ncbi:hypothetical protein M2432_004601 [Mycobacterium sp. OTB74]|nr:hypothetical protein [Mycobacterium sp. OTB74]